ncbi:MULTISPECIES: hypothetical protein [Mesorhizobium]|uniref:hypothetical protein n=1 Tax=Mesorhizobium TaxID=68287 RepID=UPI0007FBD5EA|nr:MULTISPECIES: hypothetical protein [Mesorhizobium]MUT27250.1 hypothetical protein [Mesorhizobium japonicum]OBQ83713.1 hypothetical protein A9K71_23065 [Mesorhizobium sp. WSM3873]
MKKVLIGAVIVIGVPVVANGLFVTWPALRAKADDPRNSSVSLYVHYQWGVDPSTLVLDVWNIAPTASMADVDRVLLDTAEAFKDRSFSKVQLAFRSQARFQFEGWYFRRLGEERAWQNPVYTIRTMAEHMEDPAGRPAFETWTGGLLGVVSRQMQDHSEMHRRWYINDLARGMY